MTLVKYQTIWNMGCEGSNSLTCRMLRNIWDVGVNLMGQMAK